MAEPTNFDLELLSYYSSTLPAPWIENPAISSNGELLLIIIISLDIYSFKPCDLKEVVLVHRLEEVLELTGIIEF
jgi:hypothetical protein